GQIPAQDAVTQVEYHIDAVDAKAARRSPRLGEHRFLVGTAVTRWSDDFEASVGWTSGGTASDWQIGQPRGRAGFSNSFGWQDPLVATSGTTVRGTDLGGTTFNGAYANNQNSFLQSPSIPTNGRQGLRLRFRRFLSVVTGDVARVLVNGTSVWSSTGSVYDTEWQWIDYDVSSILNTASNAVVRFELTTNASNAAGGWQIDDVALVTLHDAAPATTYGTGTPGTGAIVPTLAVRAPPVLGTTVQFQAQGLLANSAGLLGLGVQPANTPVLGLQLLVDPAGLALLTAPISAGGAAAWPFAVPGTPALDNVVLYAQAFGLDGGAPGGLLSASAGLRVRLCVSAP
ncbi:MAG: hypothetical protein ACK51X_01235, partial [Planctomycetota bacterium]